jgi:hypothetical protein
VSTKRRRCELAELVEEPGIHPGVDVRHHPLRGEHIPRLMVLASKCHDDEPYDALDEVRQRRDTGTIEQPARAHVGRPRRARRSRLHVASFSYGGRRDSGTKEIVGHLGYECAGHEFTDHALPGRPARRLQHDLPLSQR